MALSAAELLDLADAPRNPAGELLLVSRLLQRERLLTAAVIVPLPRPVLARAA